MFAFNFRDEFTVDISEGQCGNVALRLSEHLEYTFQNRVCLNTSSDIVQILFWKWRERTEGRTAWCVVALLSGLLGMR